MARSPTPADRLAPSSGKLPPPKFTIGEQVRFVPRPIDKGYERKQYLRYLIRQGRRFTKHGRLHSGSKNIIRGCLRVFDTAPHIEVAGIQAQGMHAFDCDMYNESYVSGMAGISSPARYHYQLLFRWTDEQGRRLAMITGFPVAWEHSLQKVEIERDARR